jgi:hypothetical protein
VITCTNTFVPFAFTNISENNRCDNVKNMDSSCIIILKNILNTVEYAVTMYSLAHLKPQQSQSTLKIYMTVVLPLLFGCEALSRNEVAFRLNCVSSIHVVDTIEILQCSKSFS